MLRTDKPFPKQRQVKKKKKRKIIIGISTKGRTHYQTVLLEVRTLHFKAGCCLVWLVFFFLHRLKIIITTGKHPSWQWNSFKLKLSWLHIPQEEIYPKSIREDISCSGNLCSMKLTWGLDPTTIRHAWNSLICATNIPIFFWSMPLTLCVTRLKDSNSHLIQDLKFLALSAWADSDFHFITCEQILFHKKVKIQFIAFDKTGA